MALSFGSHPHKLLKILPRIVVANRGRVAVFRVRRGGAHALSTPQSMFLPIITHKKRGGRGQISKSKVPHPRKNKKSIPSNRLAIYKTSLSTGINHDNATGSRKNAKMIRQPPANFSVALNQRVSVWAIHAFIIPQKISAKQKAPQESDPPKSFVREQIHPLIIPRLR
jgi:hypothetical protein